MASAGPTYKAYVYEQYGNTEDQIQLRDVVSAGPVPSGRVRIKVHSAALNPVDHCIVEFLGPALTGGEPSKENPYRIGFDVAGKIVEVGDGVDASKLKVSDAVYAMAPFHKYGTIAEYIDIDQQYVSHKPKSMDYDRAASVPLAALTSYQGIFEHVKLEAGQRILILGGSSSTGIFAVQFAKIIGAYVITTASAKNAEFVKSLGADEVIDYRSQKWSDVVEAHSLDVFFDCGMEPNAWNGEAQSVLKKETGKFITLQFTEESQPAKYGATNLGMMNVQPSSSKLDAIATLIDGGKLKTVIDSVLSFDKAAEGITRVKSRRAVGKVVIKVL